MEDFCKHGYKWGECPTQECESLYMRSADQAGAAAAEAADDEAEIRRSVLETTEDDDEEPEPKGPMVPRL